ncbi:peptidylprolyl isomerase [Clostridioides difficile]|uniref:peptidylprolyl isomerase n=1 Tax=Clostridioides difficile TaxID=1496 RepID=UPI00038CD129|nr:peptidylprolyl isomerase [Clostridioides difficile]EQE71457.1 surA N-terminal domain protein [Clostridioides difficile CD47]EQH40354.1 surA N-terminal domain protein [Clostridioides difficile DA00238]EQH82616.1 surA N-terminal domain protein [Clostridioides difficile DA00307]MCE4751189.1 peptidylprolyl isomerase [Clostridioides difficile]MCZ8472361.1 peptidylprolyl isomerase [Clostridioides difficile]
MNKKIYIGMVGILSLMMVGCNKSLAKVNDVEITKEQYKKTKAVLSATNNYINGQSLDELEKTLDKKGRNKLENVIISFMVDNELLYQEAKDKGLTPSKSEVDSKYQELEDKMNLNTSYKEKMDKAGVDKDYLKQEISRDLAIDKNKKAFEDRINISDNDMEAYYTSHKKDFNVEEVSASQILISTLDKNKKEVSKDKKEALKKKADNILTKIKNGESFESLTKKYSDDKATGKNGGQLGYFTKDDKNAEFTKEVFKLKKNEVSNVFETSYGYHIVKVTDKRERQKSFNECQSLIRESILNEKYIEHIKKLNEDAKIDR